MEHASQWASNSITHQSHLETGKAQWLGPTLSIQVSGAGMEA